jgi:short-subunit dehydrogenase
MTDFIERYGPVALVTGASSGIGTAFAEALAAKGMGLVLVARRLPRLEDLAARLTATHDIRVTVCEADLADAGATQEILDATASIDVGLVVSNAGYGFKGPHESQEAKAIADMLMVNCTAPMLLTRGFIPRLRRRGKGGIVLVGSVEGLIGCPYSSAYSASKALVKSLGEGLWGELTPDGIDVLTVLPGATATEALTRAGMDAATMPNVMAPEDVAVRALDHIADGPTLVASDHYGKMFDQLLAMPRRDALKAMANSMRP